MTNAKKKFRRTLGNNLRRWRGWRQLTQNELGEISGIGGDTIRNLETARRGMSVDKLVALCKALEVEPAELLKDLI